MQVIVLLSAVDAALYSNVPVPGVEVTALYDQPEGSLGQSDVESVEGVPETPQIAAPTLGVGVVPTPVRERLSSIQVTAPGSTPTKVAWATPILAFALALFTDVKTIDERIPIIAITTRSSINVKPLFFFIKSMYRCSLQMLFED